MIKIVIDAFGGDYSPDEIVFATIEALAKYPDLSVVLTGDEGKLNEFLKRVNFEDVRLQIVSAPQIITNDESPTVAIRTKTDSSLVKAFDILRNDDEVCGIVAAGSTGAVLTAAFMKLGRIKGVSRPALCPILPTVKGGNVAIVDCGANMDSKPVNLQHFALMGSAYMQNIYGIEKPRVALLSVGVEDHKGNELTKEVFELLKNEKSINFVGNMEARDLLTGDYDVVVTDGFSGNVLLKSSEGAILALLKMLKNEITSSFFSKIGALFMKKSFRNLKKRIDYNNHGGAVLLGAKKLVVKSHGSSKRASILASIEQVISMHNADLCNKIEKSISDGASE